MENVRDIVSQIINSPQLRENLEHAVRSTLHPISGRNSVPTPSRNTTVSTGNVREELNRLFPSTSSRTRHRNRNRLLEGQTDAGATFHKDVFLSKSKDSYMTYKHASKSLAYETGYAVSDVKFNINWSIEEIKSHLTPLFGVLNGIDFEIVLPVGGRLTKIQHGVTLNGTTVKRMFNQKPIYLRPTENLHRDSDDIPLVQLLPASNTVNNVQLLPSPSITEPLDNITINDQYSQDLSLEDILVNLQANITENTTQFNIYRSDIFQCCIGTIKRKSFNPFNKIDVKFSDIEGTAEGAVDAGGPTREMFRLVLNSIKNSHLFIGIDKKFLTLNSGALEKNEYFYAGVLIAMSLIHGGAAPHFFSENLYEALYQGIEKCTPSLDFIDPEIREKIENIYKIDNIDELENYIRSETVFAIAGFYVINGMDKREQLIQGTMKFFNCYRVRPAFDQLVEGLKTCHIYEAIVSHSGLFRAVMCEDKQKITSKLFQDVFQIIYSEIGSNRRETENRIISFFRDVLQDIEDGEDITLADLLIFCTGADNVPPLGFTCKPKILFLHESKSSYPTANTCGLELCLPCSHSSYEEFKEHMIFAIGNCKDFAYA